MVTSVLPAVRPVNTQPHCSKNRMARPWTDSGSRAAGGGNITSTFSHSSTTGTNHSSGMWHRTVLCFLANIFTVSMFHPLQQGSRFHRNLGKYRVFFLPGLAGVRGNEIGDELARDGSILKFVGPEPALGVSRQDIRRSIRRWLVNQDWIWWRGLGDTQRQARELIWGPCLGAKARFLSFNRTHSRAVTGLLNGHNTLRRPLHLMGLSDSPLCWRCGAEDETSAHILCWVWSFGFAQTFVYGLLLLGARGH